MYSTGHEIVIAAPPAAVFAALADPAVQQRYERDRLLSVEQVTPGPIGKGTVFRGEFAGLVAKLKGSGKVEWRYAEYEADRLIEHALTTPLGPGRHRFELEPHPDGTLLRQTMSVDPNALGRVSWVIAVRRLMLGRLRQLGGRVKTYVEAGGALP